MDVAEFLSRYPPFDAVDEERLRKIADTAQTRSYPAGTTILRESGEPASFLYVIREGAVEIREEGRLLDLMGEGEVFGAWSLLGKASPLASVIAHEDTTCHLIEPSLAEEVFETSAGMAFVVSTMRRRITRIEESREADREAGQYRPVRSLVRRPPVTCEPSTSVADAAALMSRERVSSLLIPHGDGWGILTDRDLRDRVVACGRSTETPVAEVMSFPAQTVTEETMAGEVLLFMLERGFHHFPVVDERGRVTGVLADTDLIAVGRHTPFALKSSIERAPDRDAVVAAARDLPEVVCGLVDASVDPVDVGHVMALSIDTLTKQFLKLGTDRLGQPPVPWAWLALGSAARLEQALHTDQDHALAYNPRGRPEDEIDPYFTELAEFVTSGLEDSGIPRCRGEVMATNKGLRRSVEGWAAAFRRWMDEIGLEGSFSISIMFDFRQVTGPLDVQPALAAVIRSAPQNRPFIRHLSRRALDDRPPTGFFRDFVVQAKGDHVGRLDVKHGGITIIGSLARAYAVGAGLTEPRTLARLAAAASAGAITEDTRRSLEEVFRFLWGIRLEHQVAQAKAGEPPDDFVDPAALGPVARRGLKEAFRIISRAQKSLGETVRLPTA